jgi:hypothetical protein
MPPTEEEIEKLGVSENRGNKRINEMWWKEWLDWIQIERASARTKEEVATKKKRS